MFKSNIVESLKKFYMIDLLTSALNDQLQLAGNRKFSIRTN